MANLRFGDVFVGESKRDREKDTRRPWEEEADEWNEEDAERDESEDEDWNDDEDDWDDGDWG
jgi:hypothetical protein